jgi:hypothetical protein
VSGLTDFELEVSRDQFSAMLELSPCLVMTGPMEGRDELYLWTSTPVCTDVHRWVDM